MDNENKNYGFEDNNQQSANQQNTFNASSSQSNESGSQQNVFNGNTGYGQSYEFNSQQNAFPNQPNYGAGGFNSNYGMGQVPLDKNGQPVKNRYGMKITFAVLEILTILGCNVLTFILGIIAAVFTSKANASYQQGRWDDFKSEAKTSTVLLWIGFSGFMIEVVIIFISLLMGVSLYNEIQDSYDYRLPKTYEGSSNAGNTDDTDYFGTADSETESTENMDQSTEAPAITPSNVTPGEGFVEPSFTLNGAAITLPLDYADVKELGFYIDTEDEEYYMNKNEYFYPDVFDANGNEIGCVYIGNVTDGAIPMKEGLVFGFEFSNEDDMDAVADVVFSNGVTFSSTKEDLITAFGEPDNSYESESYDSQEYTWYNHSDQYYDSSENSIEFSYWEGVMDEITIRYIGWD